METNLFQADGSTERGALFNYHEYRLPSCPGTGILYHVFVVKDRAKKRSGAAPDGGHKLAKNGASTPPPDPRRVALRLALAGDTKNANFLEFMHGPGVCGRLTESDTGGLQLQSTGGDVAEWHGLADGQADDLKEGDVVSIVDGLVSLQCYPGAMLAVVTRKAMVEGSIPKDTWRHETLAYAGRVPVRVRGPVCCGDRIIPSGLHDGTGMRAAGSSGWQPTVGTVLSLGDEPECTGQPWVVEIAVTPPGLTVTADTRRPSLWLVSMLLLVAMTIAGLLYARTPDEGSGGASSTGTNDRMEQVGCTLARWHTVLAVCEHELSTFYSESDPYGEGGILNLLQTQRTELNDLKRSVADMVIDSLDLGSVIAIGTTCSSRTGQKCAESLREYLDGCPLAPLRVKIEVPEVQVVTDVPGRHPRMGPHSGGDRNQAAGSMDGMADVMFVRQCLSRLYPQLLTPNTLAVPMVSATQDETMAASAHQEECRALEHFGEAVRTKCAACAIDAECNEPRSARAILKMFSSCPIVKDLPPNDLPQLHNTTIAGRTLEYFSIPAVDVVGDRTHSSLSTLLRVLWVEEQQQPDRSCFSQESSCRCYARGTECNSAIASALAKLAATPHYSHCATAGGRDGTIGLPPSALATMLYAAEGQRFFQVVEGSAASAAKLSRIPFHVVVGEPSQDNH